MRIEDRLVLGILTWDEFAVSSLKMTKVLRYVLKCILLCSLLGFGRQVFFLFIKKTKLFIQSVLITVFSSPQCIPVPPYFSTWLHNIFLSFFEKQAGEKKANRPEFKIINSKEKVQETYTHKQNL